MKSCFALIVFILSSVWSVSSQSLTIASYNVRFRNDNDVSAGNAWSQRCPIVCNLIRFNDFEIFGAQEVLDDMLGDMLTTMPEYGYVGVARIDGKKNGEYSPIFYKKERIKLLDSGTFWLSEQSKKPSRGWDASMERICTWGKFSDKQTGVDFWFFNVHMDHVGVTSRTESAKLVLSKIKKMCGDDLIIFTGDFNAPQNTECYKVLHESKIIDDAYLTAKIRYAPNGTYNGFNTCSMTDERIDHIFVDSRLVVERYGVLTDTYRTPTDDSKGYMIRMPSDHFPLKVELRFAK